MPWRRYLARKPARCPAIPGCFRHCACSWRTPRGHTRIGAHRVRPISACGTEIPACETTMEAVVRKPTQCQACPAGLPVWRSTACDLQPRPFAALEPAQLCLFLPDVIPRHRHHVLALGDLDLEIHQVLLAERH